MTITSTYIAGVAIPTFDTAITDAMNEYEIDGGGNTMNIAIENPGGEIYRVVTTSGMGAYIHATTDLGDLGLRDLLSESINGKNGYDSWFVVPPGAVIGFDAESVKEDQKPKPNAATDILDELEVLKSLPDTEREATILARVGQGPFRQSLIDYWGKCAVTGAECIPLLRASHTKPWRDATPAERLDLFNGLLLMPNLDAAFDAGYISFDDTGKVLLSALLTGNMAYQLHLTAKMRIPTKMLTTKHKEYLAYHRDNVFRG